MKKIFTYNQNNVDRKSKICFSCIPSNQQEILIQHIEEMGGEIVNELTKKTSFLIASKINTEKVMVSKNVLLYFLTVINSFRLQ